MRFEKKALAALERCYAVSTLFIRGKKHFAVASEKDFPCLLLDEHGAFVEQVSAPRRARAADGRSRRSRACRMSTASMCSGAAACPI